jgi:hypothetical protein
LAASAERRILAIALGWSENTLLDRQVIEDVLDDLVIEIVAAEMVVAVARYHLDDTCFYPHDRRIKGPPDERVKDRT